MAKLIRLTPNELDQLRKEFEEVLANLKMSEGKLSFTKTFSFVNKKAKIYITALAWAKMRGLVTHFDKEVAWHGVAYRGEDESKDEYYITDILVYPQTVTGTNVDMNVDEYDKWIRDNDEDERMFNLRMQGHSHVNMGVTPSGVDLHHNDEILKMLPGNGFYIFMILNKKWDKTVKIYDLKKNLFFDTADCEIEVLGAPAIEGAVFTGVSDEEANAAMRCVSEMRIEKEVDGFVKESESMVKNKTYAPYNGGTAAGYYPYTQPSAGKTAPAKTEPKTAVVPVSKTAEQNGKKKKGKRRGAAKTSASSKAPQQKGHAVGFAYEDEDDYCASFYDYWR